jgi:Pentapeptide repeats (8 copies)
MRALGKVLFVAACFGLVLATHAQAQESQTCPHPKEWKPSGDELKQIRVAHEQWLLEWQKAGSSEEWASQHPQGRARLCNAVLSEADLREAVLNKADLSGAELSEADLSGAELNEADLSGAELNEASLVRAELNEANLVAAKLNEASLVGAKLNEANLFLTELNKADLGGAELNKADLSYTELNEASLVGAELNEASLIGAELNEASLVGAELNEANLEQAELKDATLADAQLVKARYAPASPPPAVYVAGIQGLETVTFPPGQEIGLVQLRKLFQDGGLRELERQATYAIEHGRTGHTIQNWKSDLIHAVEGVFRFIAFDLTTGYGLHPGRSLLILFALICFFTQAYAVAIVDKSGTIYRVWPAGRIQHNVSGTELVKEAKLEQLDPQKVLPIFGYSLQFSLLSAFHIGFREFSVGTWLARLQGSQYTLEALGWVRRVSGLQSLLSVYLLAMWALTYFGRPFQ